MQLSIRCYLIHLKLFQIIFLVKQDVNICVICFLFIDFLPHNIVSDGFEIFAHIANTKIDNIFNAIQKLTRKYGSENQVKVVLGSNKSSNLDVSELREACYSYFEKNYRRLGERDPLVLSSKIPKKFKEIVDTMQSWCSETNVFSNIKGLVVHSYSITEHLKWLKFTEDTLGNDLDLEELPSTPITVAYNPKEKVIFLIRRAESENLEYEVKLGEADLKMFMLLYSHELKASGIKLIPLIVTDGEVSNQVACNRCENCLISIENFKNYDMFRKWWINKAYYFEIKNTEEVNEVFSICFPAKIIGFMAATQNYHFIPTFTKDSYDQMEEASLLLTREQINILDSQSKHLIIKGSFGTGKSIVARVKLQNLSANLSENEMLYYVCYDPRSELFNGIEISPKVKLYHNKEGIKLTDIITDILKENRNKKQIHLFIDEYDGEDLNRIEGNKLNKFISENEKFREAFVFLIIQPIEKERQANNIVKESHMFSLLKTMKIQELNLTMRNSIEIDDLVHVAKKVLQEQKTIFVNSREDKNDASKSTESTTKVNKRLSLETSNSSSVNIDNEDKMTLKKQSDSDNKGLPIAKMGIDEAFEVSELLSGRASTGSKVVNKFSYVVAEETGHKISCRKPRLFELHSNCTEVEKITVFRVIFQHLNISSSNAYSKHVILHFDTTSDDIPEIIDVTFKSLGIKDQVTNRYEDFKGTEKSILVCSYPKFRGLENSRITVVINRDIYFLQHYVVEAIARCTSQLDMIVMEKIESLTAIIEKWKSGFCDVALIEPWKVMISEDKEQNRKDFIKDENEKLITIYNHSRKHQAILKEYEDLKNKKKDGDDRINTFKKVREAKKIVKKR